MRTTTSNGWVRGFAGVAVAALLLGAGVLSCPPAAMGAIDPPGAPMAAPGSRVHPDASLFLVVPDDFSVFSGGGMPPEYSLVASLAGTPDGGTMDVVMYSQVWKHDDGHLLLDSACMGSLQRSGFEAIQYVWRDCPTSESKGSYPVRFP